MIFLVSRLTISFTIRGKVNSTSQEKDKDDRKWRMRWKETHNIRIKIESIIIKDRASPTPYPPAALSGHRLRSKSSNSQDTILAKCSKKIDKWEEMKYYRKIIQIIIIICIKKEKKKRKEEFNRN